MKRAGATVGAAIGVASLALALWAAPAPRAAAAGAIDYDLRVGGRTRTYHLFRPADLLPGAPVPLVLSLHGGFGSGKYDERVSGWDAKAAAEGFIVAYPDGIRHSWNAGTCCGPASRDRVDDVGFLTALVEHLVRQGLVDPRRVFVAGMSNGAAMAYRLACESRLKLAAIGVVAGGLSVPCPTPQPVSVLAIHGTADPHIPVGGGIGPAAFVKLDWPAIDDVIALWRRVDDCHDGTQSQSGSVATDQAACADGRAVTLITIDGAGHQWPGGRPPQPGVARLLGLDPPSGALDATAVLWDFFRTRPPLGD